jgi:hypothetical protein
MKTTIRFFTYGYAEDGGVDIAECSEGCFIELKARGGEITYERHTVRENGVDQICLTIEPNDYPELEEVAL